MVSSDVFLSELVEDRQFGTSVHFEQYLRNVLEPNALALEAGQMSQRLGKGLLNIKRNLSGLLCRSTYCYTVVGSISLKEVGRGGCRIELGL